MWVIREVGDWLVEEVEGISFVNWYCEWSNFVDFDFSRMFYEKVGSVSFLFWYSKIWFKWVKGFGSLMNFSNKIFLSKFVEIV